MRFYFILILILIGFTNAKSQPKDSAKTDGVYITLGTNILFTKSGFLQDTFGRNSVTLPAFAIYSSYKFAPFLEFSRLSVEGENNKRNVSYTAAFFRFGLCNHVKLNENLNLRLKYGFQFEAPLAYSAAVDVKSTIGPIAGLGLQSDFSRRLSVYLALNYQQQNKNMNGLLISSGIGLKLSK